MFKIEVNKNITVVFASAKKANTYKKLAKLEKEFKAFKLTEWNYYDSDIVNMDDYDAIFWSYVEKIEKLTRLLNA